MAFLLPIQLSLISPIALYIPAFALAQGGSPGGNGFGSTAAPYGFYNVPVTHADGWWWVWMAIAVAIIAIAAFTWIGRVAAAKRSRRVVAGHDIGPPMGNPDARANARANAWIGFALAILVAVFVAGLWWWGADNSYVVNRMNQYSFSTMPPNGPGGVEIAPQGSHNSLQPPPAQGMDGGKIAQRPIRV